MVDQPNEQSQMLNEKSEDIKDETTYSQFYFIAPNSKILNIQFKNEINKGLYNELANVFTKSYYKLPSYIFNTSNSQDIMTFVDDDIHNKMTLVELITSVKNNMSCIETTHEIFSETMYAFVSLMENFKQLIACEETIAKSNVIIRLIDGVGVIPRLSDAHKRQNTSDIARIKRNGLQRKLKKLEALKKLDFIKKLYDCTSVEEFNNFIFWFFSNFLAPKLQQQQQQNKEENGDEECFKFNLSESNESQ